MGITRILKPGLLVYEFVRIFLTVYVLASFFPGKSSIPFLFMAVPFVLFPLMALFIWLDTEKYKAYLPLYLAGKCVCVFILTGWLILFSWGTIYEGGGILRFMQTLLLSGDLFSIAAVLVIMKNTQNNPIETPKVEET
jgi:hypothetical protein